MTEAEQIKLYTEFRPKVLSYIRSRVNSAEDAEDLCEDVFEKAFRAADRYDPDKAARGTWIFTITRNTVIDYFRKIRPTEEVPEDIADGALPEDEILQRELLASLAEALEGLPDELTDIIVMRYYDRLPLTEIAERMRLSYGVVKLRHQKALKMLRNALEPGSGPVLRII